MAVGDIWLRGPTTLTHYDSAGAEILRVPYLSGQYDDYNNPPVIVHDGASVWTLKQSDTHVFQFDPATLTEITHFDLVSQGTTGSYYNGGLAVRDNGHTVAVAIDLRRIMEIDHTGTKVTELDHNPDPPPPARRVSIAPGSGVLVWVSDDTLGANHVVVSLWTIDTDSIVTVTAPKPGAVTGLSHWNIAAKTDGGFWISWSGGANGFQVTEYDPSGSIIQTIGYASSGSLWHSEITGMDVDASGNLVTFEEVYDTGHTPNDYYRLMRYAPTTGVATQLGSDIALANYDSIGPHYIFLHVERSFTSSPPWLRQWQRDDVTRQYARNGPSSSQASIRQGPRGTYL